MAHTDPIADMLTRIRNASRARQHSVTIPHSVTKSSLLDALVAEGFLSAVETVAVGTRKTLVVTLKYTDTQRPVIEHLERISKPGRRVYVGYESINQVRQGMGVAILSTPKGLLTDAAARQQKVGGELMCAVW